MRRAEDGGAEQERRSRVVRGPNNGSGDQLRVARNPNTLTTDSEFISFTIFLSQSLNGESNIARRVMFC